MRFPYEVLGLVPPHRPLLYKSCLLVNADAMNDGSLVFSGALDPPVHLPPQFTSLSSIANSQTEIEPVDLVCSEDSSSLGGYRSFCRVPKDADIVISNHENTTNFCLGNSGEFLHRVLPTSLLPNPRLCQLIVWQVGSHDSKESSSVISSSSTGNNQNGTTFDWSVGNHKLDISASLGRILESSKRKDGQAAVSEFMSTMDAQVIAHVYKSIEVRVD
jgi:hypothetical protein